MPKTKVTITNDRMLQLMEWCLRHGLATSETDYLNQINFPRSNIRNVESNLQWFTREHIYNACKVTGASADYIYGFTNVMMRSPGKTGIELMREAMATLEIEQKSNEKTGNKNGNRTGRQIKKQKLKSATVKRLVK